MDGPNGGLRYEYDEGGNRTKLTQLDGDGSYSVNYGYDELSRLHTVSTGGQVLATIGYDEVGNRQSVSRLNGVNSTYTYDALNRLNTLAHQRGGTRVGVLRLSRSR